MLLLRICCRCRALLGLQALQGIRNASSNTTSLSPENIEVLSMLGFSESDYKRVLPKRTIREWQLKKAVDMLTVCESSFNFKIQSFAPTRHAFLMEKSKIFISCLFIHRFQPNLRLGFSVDQIRKKPNILRVHPYLIDHRFKILEESGVAKEKITLERISKFPSLTTTRIGILKNISLIGKETDVMRNILSYSDIPTDLYPHQTSDGESLGSAQSEAVQIYISWKLGLSKQDVESKYTSYFSLHQKSIRLIMQGHDILINKVGLSKEKIKKNMYLFHGHPDNFLEILERIPTIGNAPIESVAQLNTKILMRPVYKMLNILDTLKKYNVDEGIDLYSSVLTLSPDTVKERLENLYADPLTQLFFCSPRLHSVISRYFTYVSRAQLLKDLKWRCQSLHLLTAQDKEFHRRIKLGHDGNRGNEGLYYIQKALGFDLKEIRKKLNNHPFFTLIPLTTVSATLQLLLDRGFEKTEIFSALPIVLYPKEKVERWLEQVHTQPEVQSVRDEEGRISPGLVLHLVLYYMERPYHFSGHAVWTEGDVTNAPCVL